MTYKRVTPTLLHLEETTRVVLTWYSLENLVTIDLHSSLTCAPKKDLAMRRASWVHKQEHNLHQIRKTLLCQKILHTQLFKNLISSKVSLKNYEGLTNLHEHIQNIKSIIKLITQDNDVMCKVLLAALHGSTRAWYHSLEFVFILHFRDFNSKLISYFNISILARKNTINLFIVTKKEDGSTNVYL